jgi:hypothetical protein
MGEVVHLADRKAGKPPSPDAGTATGATTARTGENNERIQFHRATLRDQIIGSLGLVRDRIGVLKESGKSVERFEQQLEALQPRVREFHSYCPAARDGLASHGRLSTVMLSPTQFVHKSELVKDLSELVQLIDHAIKKSAEIATVRRQLNALRDIVKPRQLRMENWEDADITVSWVIDAAADPQSLIKQADKQLDDAEVALAEHRWSDAATLINDAQAAPGFLHAASMAAAHGHLQEIEEPGS